MNKLRIALLIGTCFLTYFSQAQEESEPADTVIIVKDPVVVRKQVFAAPTPTNSTNTLKKWGIETFFIGGKPMLASSNSTQLTPNPLFIGGLLLTRNIKNLELGIGVSLMKGSFNYKSSNTTSSISSHDSTYTILLDSYIQNIGGKDTTVYITEQRDTSLTKTNYTYSSQTGNPSFTYIQIPVSIGYKINIWKERFYIIPRIQFNYGILVQSSLEAYDSPKISTFGYTAQLNLMYNFDQRFSIIGKTQWQSNFTSPYPLQTMQSLTYGLGLAVHF